MKLKMKTAKIEGVVRCYEVMSLERRKIIEVKLKGALRLVRVTVHHQARKKHTLKVQSTVRSLSRIIVKSMREQKGD